MKVLAPGKAELMTLSPLISARLALPPRVFDPADSKGRIRPREFAIVVGALADSAGFLFEPGFETILMFISQS